VISHAALTLRQKAASARVHLENERSISLLEQLGFQREGVLRGYVERDGARRD
jgi:RimJ/RimL family protein N-acetyltransferase